MQKGEHISVNHCGSHFPDDGKTQAEAGIAFKSRKIQGDNGDLIQIGFMKSFAEKMNIVAGPAAAAGLGDD